MEQEGATCSEYMMRELLKLDEFVCQDQAEKVFRKGRISQIQKEIQHSDGIIKEIQKLESQFGIQKLTMKL